MLIPFIRETLQKWNADNAFRLSASLAYYTLFSLGPLLILATSIAGFAFGAEAANGELYGQLRGLLGSQGAQAVQAILSGTQKSSNNWTASLVSVTILLFGATGVFVELKSALNFIWRVEAAKTSGLRALLRDRLFSFAMVLSVGFLLLVSLIISALLSVAEQVFSGYLPSSVFLMHSVSSTVSFVLVTCLFALIFKLLPDTKMQWRDVWLGSLLTSVLFTLGKYLIGLYLGSQAIASAYGASGSVVVILIWSYYSALILFLGAEFTEVFSRYFGSRRQLKQK